MTQAFKVEMLVSIDADSSSATTYQGVTREISVSQAVIAPQNDRPPVGLCGVACFMPGEGDSPILVPGVVTRHVYRGYILTFQSFTPQLANLLELAGRGDG